MSAIDTAAPAGAVIGVYVEDAGAFVVYQPGWKRAAVIGVSSGSVRVAIGTTIRRSAATGRMAG